ncbi:MAG: SMC family ATPase [bacterium]|nr:SMC family ATPase [bacterium]
MRLISCHIDNFGTFHDFDLRFEEDLNVIVKENGWGKSTLAAFLIAMLYGFGSSRKQSIKENDRKHYLPWQGGKYGGTLTFEKEGKCYLLSRTFGATQRGDSMCLQEADTKRILPVEKVGEWLFELDEKAFRRSAFLGQIGIPIEGADSGIHTRLNAILHDSQDVRAYDAAMDALTEKIKEYEKRGQRGRLHELQGKLEEVLQKQKKARVEIQQVEEARQSIIANRQSLLSLQKEINALKKEISAKEAQTKEVEATLKLHQELEKQKRDVSEELTTFLQQHPLPKEEEVQELKEALTKRQQVREELQAQKEERQQKLLGIRKQYEELLSQQKDLEGEERELLSSGAIPTKEELLSLQQNLSKQESLLETLANLDKEQKAERMALWFQYQSLKKEWERLQDKAAAASSYASMELPDPTKLSSIRHEWQEYELLSQEEEELRKKREALPHSIPTARNAFPFVCVGFGILAAVLGFLLSPLLFAASALLLLMGFCLLFANTRKKKEKAALLASYEDKLSQLNQKKVQREQSLQPFLAAYSIPLTQAKRGLTDLEAAIENASRAKQAVALQNQRVLDFTEANPTLFASEEDSYETPAMATLRQQEKECEQSIKELLLRYSVEEDSRSISEWMEQSNKSMLKQKELQEKQEQTRKECNALQKVYPELCGKEETVATPAFDRLQKQEKSLNERLQSIQTRYCIGEEELETWIRSSQTKRKELEELKQRKAALFAQVEDFEREHKQELHFCTNEKDPFFSLRQDLQIREKRKEALQKECTQAESDIAHSDVQLQSYRTLILQQKYCEKELQKAKKSLFILRQSQAFLEQAKEALTSRYMGQMEANFNRYLSAWLKSDKLQALVDAEFSVKVEEDGKEHILEGYSSGYIDMMDFCMRMALVDSLFEKERPFLIMDDPFVNLDEEHLEYALRFLKGLAADSQILYFVCHPIRAHEPKEGELSIDRKQLLKPAKKRQETVKKAPKKEKYLLKSAPSLKVLTAKKRITNNLFSLEFAMDSESMKEAEWELFFVDEKERVLCDKQQVTVTSGEVFPKKLCFCLNTGEAFGSSYTLMIRNMAAPESEVANKIPFEAALTFTSDFDF